MAELQSREGRMMIDSVVWAQYINVTNTQKTTQPHRQALRHSNDSSNALRRAAKITPDMVQYFSICAIQKIVQ